MIFLFDNITEFYSSAFLRNWLLTKIRQVHVNIVKIPVEIEFWLISFE